VDDNYAIYTNKATPYYHQIIDQMKNKFGIKHMDNPTFCLGINIYIDPQYRQVHISQYDYIERSLQRFKLQDQSIVATPERTENNLLRGKFSRMTDNEKEADKMIKEKYNFTNELYLQYVGTLLYLSIMTRPDIAHAVQLLSRDMNQPTSEHFFAAQYVFRYLKGTPNYGILYKNNINKQNLINITCYSDADFAGDLSTSKSTYGFAIFLNDNLVHWCSKQQKYVAHSSCAAEYIAMSLASQDVLWIQQVLQHLQFNINLPTCIWGDNEAQLSIVKSINHHERLRSVRVAYHNIKDEYENKRIDVKWISGKENIADIFTKALPAPVFLKHRLKLVINNPFK
jgi:hypothetical protein